MNNIVTYVKDTLQELLDAATAKLLKLVRMLIYAIIFLICTEGMFYSGEFWYVSSSIISLLRRIRVIDMLIFLNGKISNMMQPPKPKLQVIKEKIDETVREAQGASLSWFYYIFIENFMLIFYFLLMMTAVILVVQMCKLALKMLVSVRNGITGVSDFRGESMVDGSDFVSASIPKYQVEIHEIGMLTSKFKGYGVRFESEWLVTPTHVIRNLRQILLKSHTGKGAMVDINPISSSVVSDLTYIRLSPKVWTSIDVTSQSCSANVTPARTVVQCVGRQGASTGALAPSEHVGLLTYTGSTLNGYSGAAYEANGLFYGIHGGVIGSNNVGYSSLVFKHELQSMIGEGKHHTSMSNYENVVKLPKRLKHTWNIADISAALKESARLVVENKKNDPNYVDWTDLLDGEVAVAVEEVLGPLDNVETKLAKIRAEKVKTRNLLLETQSGRGGSDLLQVHAASKRTVGQHIKDLEKLTAEQAELIKALQEEAKAITGDMLEAFARIKLLESKVFPQFKEERALSSCSECELQVLDVVKHIKEVHTEKKYKCGICKKKFFTNHSLLNHAKTHTKLESALPGDSQKLVQTTSFLEERLPLQKGSLPKSKKRSNLSTNMSQSMSVQESLSLMMQSLKALERSLKSEQKDTAGPSSAEMPN